jgi:hypothetical protein
MFHFKIVQLCDDDDDIARENADNVDRYKGLIYVDTSFLHEKDIFYRDKADKIIDMVSVDYEIDRPARRSTESYISIILSFVSAHFEDESRS